jgi:hypothetical protein
LPVPLFAVFDEGIQYLPEAITERLFGFDPAHAMSRDMADVRLIPIELHAYSSAAETDTWSLHRHEILRLMELRAAYH